jgi:bifunctional DNA-binding transcriptional regulator/antitoxin component of YhaV-PrlF toxin-antitoxin module
MSTTIQINKRGTLTLPMTIRKKLGLERGGAVIAEDTELGIVIKPAVTYPIENTRICALRSLMNMIQLSAII